MSKHLILGAAGLLLATACGGTETTDEVASAPETSAGATASSAPATTIAPPATTVAATTPATTTTAPSSTTTVPPAEGLRSMRLPDGACGFLGDLLGLDVVDGEINGEMAMDGRIILDIEGAAVADFDQDGGDDIVTIVKCAGGGSSSRYELLVVPSGAAAYMVADLDALLDVGASISGVETFVQAVASLGVSGGDGAPELTIDATASLPTDPNCCPGLRGVSFVQVGPTEMTLVSGMWGAYREEEEWDETGEEALDEGEFEAAPGTVATTIPPDDLSPDVVAAFDEILSRSDAMLEVRSIDDATGLIEIAAKSTQMTTPSRRDDEARNLMSSFTSLYRADDGIFGSAPRPPDVRVVFPDFSYECSGEYLRVASEDVASAILDTEGCSSSPTPRPGIVDTGFDPPASPDDVTDRLTSALEGLSFNSFPSGRLLSYDAQAASVGIELYDVAGGQDDVADAWDLAFSLARFNWAPGTETLWIDGVFPSLRITSSDSVLALDCPADVLRGVANGTVDRDDWLAACGV